LSQVLAFLCDLHLFFGGLEIEHRFANFLVDAAAQIVDLVIDSTQARSNFLRFPAPSRSKIVKSTVP
jgi:hypothetical protein